MSNPDLIRRAAERLVQEQNVRQGVPLVQDTFSRQPSHDASAEPQIARGRAMGTRTVNISPTLLAQNGIHLPSTEPGFVLTIEEYRSIRRQVVANFKRSGSSNNRTIMVTSARPGDGKTFTSINLALSLAFGRQHNVLLMDGDARRRSMANYMGIKSETGWIDLLQRSDIGLSDVVLNTNIPNLSILPSGMPPNDLPELVASPKMGKLLSDLNGFDSNSVTIMNSLPCLVSNEPAILADQVGQVIFVVAANETSREEVQASLSYLSGCPMVGMILNKGEPVMSEQFTKYGYQYNYEQT